MRFEVGCRLRYQVKAPITFVFNVAVADSACQEITEEQLRTNPALAVEEVKLVAGSRHMRLHAPASEFALDFIGPAEHGRRRRQRALQRCPLPNYRWISYIMFTPAVIAPRINY